MATKKIVTSRALTAAVLRGAKLLDTYEPKWFNKVTTANLNMESTSRCVIGQVHEEYSDGLRDLASAALADALTKVPLNGLRFRHNRTLAQIVREDGLDLAVDEIHYGFALPNDNQRETTNASWERLGAAWTKQIVSRQAAATAARTIARKATARKAAGTAAR